MLSQISLRRSSFLFVSQEALSGAAHGLPGPVQSVEALVDAGLISETLTGALGAWASGRDHVLNGRWNCSGVNPCHCSRSLDRRMGKGTAMVTLPFVLLASSASFWLWNSSLLLHQDAPSLPQPCPLWFTLQTPSITQPSSSPGDVQLRLGCTGLERRLCTRILLGPACHRPVTEFPADPPIPQTSLSVPAGPFPWVGFFGCGNLSSQLPLRSVDAIPFPLLFPLPFPSLVYILHSFTGIFLLSP